MTTFQNVIERTRRRLMTTLREPMSTLAADMSDTATGISFSNAVRFTEHSRLSVGLEDMYVVSVAGGGLSATVVRGLHGSTAAAHTAGARVHINPSWTNWEIATAVNEELDSLSAQGLFRIRSVDFDFNSATAGYELAGTEDLLDVWRVRYNTPGPSNDWTLIHPKDWRIDQAADTDDFASGYQIVLRHGGHPGQKVRVSYRATFDQLSALTDDVATVAGLHAAAHDILVTGAAIRLLSGLEANRGLMTAQGEPRRSEEVPPRTAMGSLVPLVEQYEKRVREESKRLARRYPVALTV